MAHPDADHFFSLSLELCSMAGRDGYFQRLNPAFASALGYTESDLIGHPFITFVHADDRETTQAELEKLAQGQPVLSFEQRFRRKDGEYRWLAWTAVPGLDGRVHAAAHDVTERKLAEKQRAALALAVAEQTGGLAHKNEFLMAVSHDLQQPLTLIKGQVQLLQRRLERGDSVDQALLERSLAYVNAAAARMRTMLSLLLDTALEEAGLPQALTLSPTDVAALIWQAVDEHRLAFDVYEFSFETEASSLMAMVDMSRLQRTIENLLSNAIKFSLEGGTIRVSLRTSPGETRRLLVIAVQDEGMGIPAADLPHVFDRCYRGKNVVGQIAGSGLGMAGARQMVELHGGSISVESQEGLGSTFTVRLPISP